MAKGLAHWLACLFATIFAAALAVSEATGGGAAPSPVIGRIYFVPFDVTTYTPATIKNIEELAAFEINLVSPDDKGPHPFVKSLRGMLKARPANDPFNDLAVRLKLVLTDETYYVDAVGGVLEASSKRTFRLQKTELRRIEQSIEGFFGVVDMKAFSRMHGGLLNPK